MNEAEIKKLIEASLKEFFENEQDLIDVDANERSISHKIAEYIQEKFSKWNVDCEYNRDMEDPKRLGISTENIQSDDTDGKTVFPDIIIYKRKTKQNLLVIEIKKSDSNVKNDIKKIQAFLKSPKYSYKWGLMLVIYTEKKLVGKYKTKWLPEE